MITQLKRLATGEIEYLTDKYGGSLCQTFASLNMLIIRHAWVKGCSFEAEADGYGPGNGTNNEWSGIRDSSPEAKDRMLEKALNFLGID